MKKYVIFAAGITFLLIFTSFVSSSRNSIENDYFNQNILYSCNHKGIIMSNSLYEFTLSNPGNLTNICEKSAEDSDFLSSGTWSDDYYIYGCQYNSGILYAIDIETCDMWSIGGGGTAILGIAYDPITENMYGSSDSNYLFSINPETGEQSQIGAFGSSVNYMVGLAFDSEGTLYGWDLGNDKLWTIDTDTGDATEVGSLGINLIYACDGDFCKEDDILYIAAPGSPPDYPYQLYECDKETGDCGHVGQFPQEVDVTGFVIPWDYPPENNPPYVPHNPRPMNGTTGVISGPWLSWKGGDPDGDEVCYDVYFGLTNPPPMVANNISGTIWDPFVFPPEPNTTIYWKIVAWDPHGSTEGPIWVFKIPPNYPPYPAKNPDPPDGAEQIPVWAVINWTGWDPNGWDELTYDVYFGLYDPPTQQTWNQTTTSFDPYGDGDMQLFETYYWKIVTWDREGEKSIGSVWSFSTGYCGFPVPKIDGPTECRVNGKHNYTFSIDTEDRICFEIKWGDGTSEIICPPLNLSEVIANHTWTMMGDFTIWVRAFNEHGEYSEWGQFSVSIPRYRIYSFSIFSLIIKRYPLLEVFLRLI
ncbi:hypothetical protein AYK24_10245 [Thermoplasmatales archaeon SG8-52-4]|nr:MAG: hypothetical protein AYK24_10245 [Thermoplasmatales archaeon SG8-52-4]